MSDYDATIYALSSGPPPAGIAVIRVSGPQTRFGLETLISCLPEPRKAELRTIRGRENEPIDTGLILFFPAPHSFTGEDCAEFHVHGGRAVISALLAALAEIPGFRPAEAGEFTRRAFESGRLDLTAIEGLADLVSAETEMQRRLALELAQGKLASLYDRWAERLTCNQALIEAGIDFIDEDDVPESVADGVRLEMLALRDEVASHLSQTKAAEIIHDGFRVAIVGAPNAGKSSLINALARRDVSIVSSEPGTTRDIVEVKLDLGGYTVVVQDTAGLRETAGAVEREGIRRARQAIGDADLILVLTDRTDPRSIEDLPEDIPLLHLGTKSDLVGAEAAFDGDVVISTMTGAGLAQLLAMMKQRVEKSTVRSADAIPARERQISYLRQVLGHLERALTDGALPPELFAEELRGAGYALGRITGRVDVEDLLDVIFGSFCIGK